MTKCFYAGMLDSENVYRPVVPLCQHEPGRYDDDGEWSENPDYEPNASIDLSNANADFVVDALGLDPERSCHLLDDVIARCSDWLTRTTSPSREVPSRDISFPEGPRIIDCGLPEGYLNGKVVAILKIAVHGRTMGASHLVVA